MVEQPRVILGGIIKHGQNGVGFKITFEDAGQANRAKDMLRWILLDDNMTVKVNKGYHDSKEMNYR